MRSLFGTLLGIGVMILGAMIPLLSLGMISVLIWGPRVLTGPQLTDDPARTFFTVSAIFILPVAGWTAFCLFSLPIFAQFGVRVVAKGQTRPDKTVDLARSMKAVALRYVMLMDKLIDQERV